MYISEEKIPDNPKDNQVFVDNIGIVWRWDEGEEEWIESFYSFKELEQETLVEIIKFYKSIANQSPDDIPDDVGYDIDELNRALDYLLKKLGGKDER